MNGWRPGVESAGERIHVEPVRDIAEHKVDGSPCWCQPVIRPEGRGHIVLHNVLDGRESQDVTARRDS